jgi:hypothetical protein
LIFKATVCRDCKKKFTLDDLFKRYAQLVEHEYKLASNEESAKDNKEISETESD